MHKFDAILPINFVTETKRVGWGGRTGRSGRKAEVAARQRGLAEEETSSPAQVQSDGPNATRHAAGANAGK